MHSVINKQAAELQELRQQDERVKVLQDEVKELKQRCQMLEAATNNTASTRPLHQVRQYSPEWCFFQHFVRLSSGLKTSSDYFISLAVKLRGT